MTTTQGDRAKARTSFFAQVAAVVFRRAAVFRPQPGGPATFLARFLRPAPIAASHEGQPADVRENAR
jgi:hypothetical protein